MSIMEICNIRYSYDEKRSVLKCKCRIRSRQNVCNPRLIGLRQKSLFATVG